MFSEMHWFKNKPVAKIKTNKYQALLKRQKKNAQKC